MEQLGRSRSSALMVGVVAVLFLATISSSSAQTAPPAEAPVDGAGMTPMSPPDDCFSSLTNMSDCLSFVTIGSNMTTPDKNCCPALAGLVESNPICLCQLVANPAMAASLSVDVKKALSLPKVCRVTTPPVSMCPAAPAGAPTEGPTMSGMSVSPTGGEMGLTPSMTPGMAPDAMSPPAPPPVSGAGSIRGCSLVMMLVVAVTISLF